MGAGTELACVASCVMRVMSEKLTWSRSLRSASSTRLASCCSELTCSPEASACARSSASIWARVRRRRRGLGALCSSEVVSETVGAAGSFAGAAGSDVLAAVFSTAFALAFSSASIWARVRRRRRGLGASSEGPSVTGASRVTGAPPRGSSAWAAPASSTFFRDVRRRRGFGSPPATSWPSAGWPSAGADSAAAALASFSASISARVRRRRRGFGASSGASAGIAPMESEGVSSVMLFVPFTLTRGARRAIPSCKLSN